MTTFCNNNLDQLRSLFPEFMVLRIYVDPENTNLHEIYTKEVEKHNKHLLEHPDQINAGFDLFVTDVEPVGMGPMKKINFKVACAATLHRSYGNVVIHNNDSNHTNLFSSINTGFYMYPRSSLSKTELRMANNVGIIDAGYRGNLMGLFDVVPFMERYDPEAPAVTFGQRITQLCAPGLQPIYVVMVGSLEELGETVRGNGGFGSTGR